MEKVSLPVRLLRTLLFLALMLMGSLHAATTIDTTSAWDGTNSVGTLGEGSTDTYGQTFGVIGADAVLTSFTFWLNDRRNPAAIDWLPPADRRAFSRSCRSAASMVARKSPVAEGLPAMVSMGAMMASAEMCPPATR